ncbi:outer membrane protein [Methylomarinovum caldicuralii]|uniref:Outer membrane protein n=1 Tax=Methylomarinovum caldicuralii TaxID=438856 RepID=A0AAU9BZZ0_9GAMM|nr:TolC family outer membrane protein [Methylomarinovum caldicuralii]BCX81955.1 outer membrane protein [Methylomarinovum caldicuralii]
MRHWFLLMLILSLPVHADNLLDVYRLALQNDPTIRAARASLKAGLEAEKLGLAELLPKVESKLGFNFTRKENLGQFPAGSLLIPSNTKTNSVTHNWRLQLVQPIFDLTAWFRFRRGQDLTRQAKVRFTAEQQALILRVVEAYVAVLRARANLAASKAREAATKRQLDLAKERFEVGLAAITDVREAEAGYNLAVATRLADEGAVSVAMEKLTVLTGRYHGPLWDLKADYPVEPPDPADRDAWVRFALQNNYDLKAAALEKEAARQGARAAAAEHLPKIVASAGYGHSHTDAEQNNMKQDLNSAFEIDNRVGDVSLDLAMPLFAGGGISAARRQARAEFERSRENWLGTQRTVQQATRAEYINLMTSIARIEAGKLAVASARASLEATRAGYEVGTRNIVDVLNTVQGLYAAERDYANARLDYVLARLRLKRLAGTLTPADIHALNHWLDPPHEPEN